MCGLLIQVTTGLRLVKPRKVERRSHRCSCEQFYVNRKVAVYERRESGLPVLDLVVLDVVVLNTALIAVMEKRRDC